MNPAQEEISLLSQICYKEARPQISSFHRKSNNFKPVEQKELRYSTKNVFFKNLNALIA